MKQEDPTSKHTLYFLKGCDAFEAGCSISDPPPEISKSDRYSSYLRKAWELGWETAAAQKPQPVTRPPVFSLGCQYCDQMTDRLIPVEDNDVCCRHVLLVCPACVDYSKKPFRTCTQ